MIILINLNHLDHIDHIDDLDKVEVLGELCELEEMKCLWRYEELVMSGLSGSHVLHILIIVQIRLHV